MSERPKEPEQQSESTHERFQPTKGQFELGDWASRVWGDHRKLNNLIKTHPVAQQICQHSDVESVMVRFEDSHRGQEFRVLVVLKESANEAQLRELFPQNLEFSLSDQGIRCLPVEFMGAKEYAARRILTGLDLEPINNLPIVPFDWIRRSKSKSTEDSEGNS